MDSPPKLSGETLIVHHIPLVHCQVPGRQCCGSSKHATPFCTPDNLGLTRTTSLPERDVVSREALVYSSLIQTSSSSCSSGSGGGGEGGGMEGAGRRGGSLVSDSSSFTSNNSEDPPLLPLGPKGRDKGNPLRHNPFLLNAEEDDEEYDEDDEGDNLNGYLEDSSFHLHGNSNGAMDNGSGVSPFHLHDVGFPPEAFLMSGRRSWSAFGGLAGGPEAALEGARIGALKAATRLEGLNLLGLERQCRHGSSGSTLSMDCGEQEWGEEEEDEEEDEEEEDDEVPPRGSQRGQTCSCGSSCDFAPPSSSRRRCCCCSLPEPFPEAFPEGPTGYGSDSSCNSSDGVLVNFSAIYNKMNNAVPAKPPNLNSSAEQSCNSSSPEPGGAFYLDLHVSPTDLRAVAGASPREGGPCPSSCACQTPEALDANCNSYHVPCEAAELAACVQSQARLAAATQNYYKLVTCDLSSQSSPSPPGSSIGSCSEEQDRGGSPTQATEYYLFRQPQEQEGEEAIQEDLSQDQEDDEGTQRGGSDPSQNRIEGQLYVNVSPPPPPSGRDGRDVGGATGRPRSRSYDRTLDRPPSPSAGSLERMLSCPVHLSLGSAHSPPPTPPRVTSFAEIARSKRRNGGGGSPSLRASAEATPASSHEHSPAPELPHLRESHSLPPMPLCCGQDGGARESAGRELRTRAEGGSCSSGDVVRYSKDQRPTTLPIQPFTLQHQVGKAQSKPLRPLLSEYVSQMYSRPTGQPAPDSARPSPLGSYSPVCLQGAASSGTCSTCTPPSPEPGRGRPQPPRSLSCPLQASLLPARASPSPAPGPAPALEPRPKQVRPPHTPPPAPLKKELPPPAVLPPISAHCLHHKPLPSLLAPPTATFSPLVQLEPAAAPSCTGLRALNAHHLSPQALKWREYRRRNPLGVEKTPLGAERTPLGVERTPLSGSLDTRRSAESRLSRRNVFDFPAATSHAHARPNVSSGKAGQHYYSDFFPDHFSLTEKPPEEFCLSPDATSESISINLAQKRGLVKAINTSVDLIVAHFGTSRDTGVKAKLGNSSISPNVGHLILKYLCPAIRDVLQDGLRPYVLDLIIGQRRNQPWSVVEASTQLGPSTRVLHSLFCKVSQYSELTSHSMRLNAFIFGLLNLRSLEFWFNHLNTHEDIIAAHYQPWGFLSLSQGACQPLLEELLLLLQPLSLLPFDLDLLFEPHLLQEGQEHLRRKEQLCSAGQGLEHSIRSTFQLMRGWGVAGAEPRRDGAESRAEGAGSEREKTEPRREGTWPRVGGAEPKMEGADSKRGRAEARQEGTWSRMGGAEPKMEGAGPKREKAESRQKGLCPRREEAGPRRDGMDEQMGNLGLRKARAGLKRAEPQREGNSRSTEMELWRDCGGSRSTPRVKGVGEESGQEQEETERRRERGVFRDGLRRRDRQAGWWYQLMQSSQVYIDASTEGSKFVKWEKRKRPTGESPGAGRRPTRPPPREGVVEGAEAGQEGEGPKTVGATGPRSGARGKPKPSWMGSPPESVLSELKRSREKEAETTEGEPAEARGEPTQSIRWGRLFGAGVGPSTRSQARLPSGWLSLDRSVLDFVAQTVGAGRHPFLTPPSQSQAPPPAEQPQAHATQQQVPREVRALCHHIATHPGHLSFSRGDVLQVLSRAQPDWLLCARGGAEGLVPVVYVTLSEEPPAPPGPH
ncbi:AP-4 complex accessory subunit RUSC2-like [Anguilla rostrata]|uniref:AP-4 complex accessory subunit RUSC2-like n=1 Tax=Anguilla rostrata TaxID=7938 RepID=UPI0030D2FF8F